jgi:oligopeptide/dipeptide ABC transporter ATP-binding protein
MPQMGESIAEGTITKELRKANTAQRVQIINLLIDLQAQHRISYLFIAHDLSVVEHISRRVAVMYLGHVVEYAPTEELFGDPRHPYTRALRSAVPRRTPEEVKERMVRGGEPPSPINPPPGCPFAPRCPLAQPDCVRALPTLEQMGAPGHWVRCPYVRQATVVPPQAVEVK